MHVSGKRTASFFMVEEEAKHGRSVTQAGVP
jgi:hypothetical protein